MLGRSKSKEHERWEETKYDRCIVDNTKGILQWKIASQLPDWTQSVEWSGIFGERKKWYLMKTIPLYYNIYDKVAQGILLSLRNNELFIELWTTDLFVLLREWLIQKIVYLQMKIIYVPYACNIGFSLS